MSRSISINKIILITSSAPKMQSGSGSNEGQVGVHRCMQEDSSLCDWHPLTAPCGGPSDWGAPGPPRAGLWQPLTAASVWSGKTHKQVAPILEVTTRVLHAIPSFERVLHLLVSLSGFLITDPSQFLKGLLTYGHGVNAGVITIVNHNDLTWFRIIRMFSAPSKLTLTYLFDFDFFILWSDKALLMSE